ncbi:MAG: lamin tail domain-containing protein [Bacteroidota bacterium]
MLYRLRFWPLALLFLIGAGLPDDQTDTLVLSEFMAANAGTLFDEDGDSSDWIELHNPTSEAINLAGWHLTDDASAPQLWPLPDMVVPAGGHVVVFASGKDRRAATLTWDTVITEGDTWRYRVGTSEPPVTWATASFNDSGWAEGPSGFGYDDDDDATTVPTTLSVYVRRTFTVEDASQVARALLHVDYDDAFVAYLNGTEIARANIGTPGVRPAHNATSDTFTDARLYQGQVIDGFEIANLADLLVDGENTLAIQVHNTSLTSSDLSLIPFLTLGFTVPPATERGIARAVTGLPSASLHTSFGLSSDGEYLALVAPDGTVATVFDPFPALDDDMSYGLGPDGQVGVLLSPTPGAANAAVRGCVIGALSVSTDGGVFSSAQEIAFNSPTDGATIRYTTDGSVPTATTGSVYTAPLTISETTVLRAAAFRPGFVPSPVETRTFLFPLDVVRQSPTGEAPAGWPTTWGDNDVDYGMDPNVVNSRGQALVQALRDLPSVSIATDLAHLFDAQTGIYANARERGRDWERPASVELLLPDGTSAFQIDAGLRIRGGFSRNANNPKHAFRLFFRDEYDGELVYPVFGDEGTDTFKNLDLRTSQNYSWSFYGDARNVMNRDVFSRDIQREMGAPYTRSRYYHLYLNGQYWGLFQSQERAEASYGATYLGGDADDYDVLKSTERDGGFYELEATDGNTDAWRQLWDLANTIADTGSEQARYSLYMRAQGLSSNGHRLPDAPVLLDVDNLIHYMLVIFFGGNFDAPISGFLGDARINNMYVMRNRERERGFVYFAHDNEHTLILQDDRGRDRTGPFPAGQEFITSNPQWIHQQLMHVEEYRVRFGDLAHRHLTGNGILTPERAEALFRSRASEIQSAILAESARWGDAQREPARTPEDWRRQINTIADDFIQPRAAQILDQLRQARTYADWRRGAQSATRLRPLYPDTDAPALTVSDAARPRAIFSADANATIYYTTDGSDPRAVGGTVSGTAQTYVNPLTLSSTTVLKARAQQGGAWSALVERTVEVSGSAAPRLIISEIHYHPSPATSAEADAGFADADDFEFIELHNPGDAPFDLTGVGFTEGIAFTFASGSVPADGYVVLARDPSALALRHGFDVAVAGTYQGGLSNGGETLILADAAGNIIEEVDYSDGGAWPSRPDGEGSSLERKDADDAPDDADSWRSSDDLEGSPGRAGVRVVELVVINEVLTHTDPPLTDAIELRNITDSPVDIGGWWLSDEPGVYAKFRIPDGTTIAPSGYLVFTENDFNSSGTEADFGLSSARGETLRLMVPGDDGQPYLFGETARFGAAFNGESLGRWPGFEDAFFPMTSRTLGSENSGPRLGTVVIDEVMYHPASDEDHLEFLRIANAGPDAVDLTNWMLGDGVDFAFPEGQLLAPDAMLLVVGFDPVAAPDLLASFRSTYALPEALPILGPWDGRLSNGGETVTLFRPDAPPAEEPGFFPQGIEDRVIYNDRAPWPESADGEGPSIRRVDRNAFGSDPANWRENTTPLPIDGADPTLPDAAYTLSPAYPNPFSTTTTLGLQVRTPQQVRVRVYDVLGRHVETLFDGAVPASSRSLFTWEAGNYASGVYLIAVQGDTFQATRRVLVQR